MVDISRCALPCNPDLPAIVPRTHASKSPVGNHKRPYSFALSVRKIVRYASPAPPSLTDRSRSSRLAVRGRIRNEAEVVHLVANHLTERPRRHRHQGEDAGFPCRCQSVADPKTAAGRARTRSFPGVVEVRLFWAVAACGPAGFYLSLGAILVCGRFLTPFVQNDTVVFLSFGMTDSFEITTQKDRKRSPLGCRPEIQAGRL
jgi:hypothetical protein